MFRIATLLRSLAIVKQRCGAVVAVTTAKASFANPPRPNLLALLIYLDLAIGLFGLRVIAGPSTCYLGFPKDPGVAR
jgi:hypothetical protein